MNIRISQVQGWVNQLILVKDDTELAALCKRLCRLPGLEGFLLGQLFDSMLIASPTYLNLYRWIKVHHDSENPRQIVLQLANIYLGAALALQPQPY